MGLPVTAVARHDTGAAAFADGATLVAIASAGHSGSTLLDLLLGNHSDVCSAGEMNRLTLHAADRVCACGATVTSCDYWNRVRRTIGLERQSTELIRWEECHTDVPPQKPAARLDRRLIGCLVEGARAPMVLREQLATRGLTVSERAMLSRKGVRDFSWRITDPASQRVYVLREGEASLDVYAARVEWKNPLRLIPDPLEVALAVGAPSAVKIVRACFPRAATYAHVVENSWAVADAMASVSQARFVVDSSKSPVRLKALYMRRPDRFRVVHLVRDGRAVVASAMRRLGVSPATAARVWKRDNQNLSVMLRTVPERLKLGIRYEALCENPRTEMKRVCDFLELPFEEGMLVLWERAVHNIPGNPLLFNRAERTFRKDERWR